MHLSDPSRPWPDGESSRRRTWIAHAHTGSQSYVYLVLRGREIVGSVQIPITDLNDTLDISLPERGPGGPPALAGELPEIYEYLSRHFSISAADRTAAVRFRDARFRELESGPYAFFEYRLPGFRVRRPNELAIGFDAIIESNPERDALLILMESRGWAGLRRYQSRRLRFDAETTHQVVEVRSPTFGQSLSASLAEAIAVTRRLARGVFRRFSRLLGRG